MWALGSTSPKGEKTELIRYICSIVQNLITETVRVWRVEIHENSPNRAMGTFLEAYCPVPYVFRKLFSGATFTSQIVGLLLLLLSTSYTKYNISINTKEKQKEKQKNRTAKKHNTVTTSLYAQNVLWLILHRLSIKAKRARVIKLQT